jgi:hypothetical protein
LRLYGVTGFYSLEINNWHGSSKSKNATMESAGKRISQILVRQKKCAIRYCEKCTGKSNVGKKSGKGVIAKISGNNLYQRKLL